MSKPNAISPYSQWLQQRWDESDPWPRGRHQHEPSGGTVRDCHRCGSPRIAVASRARVCVTCGWCCSDSPCPVCAGNEPPWRERRLAGYPVLPPPRAAYRRRTP